jgi:hypothetical protein
MGKIKSQLRFGLWPDSLPSTGSGSAQHPAGLTVAARRLAEATLEDLGRHAVVAALDKTGRAHFRPTRMLPLAARLAIERLGDLIEADLVERAVAALKSAEESGG